MKITAGIVFYQDAKGLARCLDSIYTHVDEIICVDGKFPEFKADSELSTDGSRELIEKYPNTRLIDFPATEVSKRNVYLKLCETECLLPIDSDEYIVGNWDMFNDNLQDISDLEPSTDIFSIRASRGRGQEFWPRIWMHPTQMEYYKAHNVFRNKKTGLCLYSATAASTLIDGITMKADDSLRDTEYLANLETYQQNLLKTENQIRGELFNMWNNAQ